MICNFTTNYLYATAPPHLSSFIIIAFYRFVRNRGNNNKDKNDDDDDDDDDEDEEAEDAAAAVAAAVVAAAADDSVGDCVSIVSAVMKKTSALVLSNTGVI